MKAIERIRKIKSYNHLFEEFISIDNIVLAIHNAAKGKQHRKTVLQAYNDIDSYIVHIIKYANNYKNAIHKPKEIYDGISRKKRIIIVPTFDELVIQHMIVNVLKPIFLKGAYFHSYGSMPNKGVHKGKKYLQKWIRNDDSIKYCLKIDIRKFFDSVSHKILKHKLSLLIHDFKFLHILFEIIDVIPTGIPLGFYTSQWFANWFLQDFDHFIKEKLHVKYYMRYMDDIVILSKNKTYLHFIMFQIERYLEIELSLILKNNKQIFLFHYIENGQDKGRFIDFMGFRFYRDRTTLRKSIMLKMTRKAKRISKHEYPTIYDCRQMLSYLGWLNDSNCYNVYLDYIKPYINIRQLKFKTSRYAIEVNYELDKS